jgi:triosephosphate isomerase (TIM)
VAQEKHFEIMRKRIAAGNWKMNLLPEEAETLFNGISEQVIEASSEEVYVFPPAIYVEKFLGRNPKIRIGVQNFHPAEKGAYTGEISIHQFKALGIDLFLVGHSERREIFHENNDFIRAKVDAALSVGAEVVFCCGEPLTIRESGRQNDFVLKQLEEGIFHLNAEELKRCTIAYEPVWAIGTGLTASVEQAQEMHSAIRSWLSARYGIDLANEISILYGGSCNAGNAKELFACTDVDGGLIGGASLDADSFIKIVRSF